MATGKVKWFNNAKGYGFILPESGEGDLFVHYSSIDMDGYKTLKAGQDVEFDVQEGPKGFHAVNIRSPEGAGALGVSEGFDSAEASDAATDGAPSEGVDDGQTASVTVEGVDVMSPRDTPAPDGQVPREGAGSG